MRFSPAKIYPARKEKKCAFLEKFLGELVVTSSRLVPAGAWKWREHFGKAERFGGCSQQIRIPPGAIEGVRGDVDRSRAERS